MGQCRRWVAGWSNDSRNIICRFPLALCTYLYNENIYIEHPAHYVRFVQWNFCSELLFFKEKAQSSIFVFLIGVQLRMPICMVGYQWQAGGVIWVLDQFLVELLLLDWEARCWLFNHPVTCDCSSCCSPTIVVATPQAQLLLTLHWLIQHIWNGLTAVIRLTRWGTSSALQY